MNYLALYRKYRPSDFTEFFGQKYIVNIIKNSIKKGRLSHAYLFSGPRGTGKTSMAKLIAKVVNCSDFNGEKTCNKCDSCLLFDNNSNPDVIEIDAASNNGVDEIRMLREKVSLVPSISKFKVYIIDEVHMLTMNAFNALLKTLEEPPAHVIFILATTELYKVPETIVSRCQCYEFERISNVDVVDCLKNIAEKEKIEISVEILNFIAEYSKGGLRDAIGILDKLASCSDSITLDLFYDVVGIVDSDTVSELYSFLLDGKKKECLEKIDKLLKTGKNLSYLVEQMMTFVKNLIVNDEKNDVNLIILENLNTIFNSMKYSANHLLTLEIGFLKIFKDLSLSDKIISREIISDDNLVKKDDVVVNDSDILNVSEQKENERNDFTKQMFVITINNAFALANKKIKIDMLKKWKDFNNYVHNKEFSSLVSYFLDGNLEVAGEKDVIISVNNDAVVQNAYSAIIKLELLFNLVMGKDYNLAFVSDVYFNELKDKYIKTIKAGKKYEYMEKKSDKSDIIINKDIAAKDESSAACSAKDIFGSDIVEIR